MKKNQLKLAVAGAVLGLASAANAGIIIPAGDWTVDLSGNVNTYYTNTSTTGSYADKVLTGGVTTSTQTITHTATGGLVSGTTAAASTSAVSLTNRASLSALDGSSNMVSTGLLPSAIGIGAKTRQNDLDVGVQFTFFTGANQSGAGTGAFNSGNGLNSLNIRQAFLTFGDKSWGTVKAGRDLGLFGSDAILSDMTLLGVGTGAGGAGNSTLGRIGSGYIYADWVGQIQYTSPNFSGFQVAAAVREPMQNANNHNMGFDGKATYDFAVNDVNGRIWVGGIYQKINAAATAATSSTSYTSNSASATAASGYTEVITTTTTAATAAYQKTARAAEVGAKINFAGLGLVGYYYDGQNLGSSAVSNATALSGLWSNSGSANQDVQGGYVQATFKVPTVGTTVGASWGRSELDGNANTVASYGAANSADYKNESWVVGAYHPLTKHLNLVAEYTDTKYENISNFTGYSGHARTGALGAILFF